VGSEFGFDSDRSGPIGWRQLATGVFEEAGILLPLFRPLLPRLPFSSVPPNHAGTFTYSLDRELNEILTAGGSEPTFVAAHTTYLHIPAYPNYLALSWEECLQVLRSPAYRIRDRSFDWQDADTPDDPIALRKWKVQRLQATITEAMERTRFLERGGRMVLFSDHGNRIGLTEENFQEDRYHHVVFATFALPRRDTDAPISLMDAGTVLGLVRGKPFDPVVEFAISDQAEWPLLVRSIKLNWDGTVKLDDELLMEMFQRLRSHRPWGGSKEPDQVRHGNSANGSIGLTRRRGRRGGDAGGRG